MANYERKVPGVSTLVKANPGFVLDNPRVPLQSYTNTAAQMQEATGQFFRGLKQEEEALARAEKKEAEALERQRLRDEKQARYLAEQERKQAERERKAEERLRRQEEAERKRLAAEEKRRLEQEARMREIERKAVVSDIVSQYRYDSSEYLHASEGPLTKKGKDVTTTLNGMDFIQQSEFALGNLWAARIEGQPADVRMEAERRRLEIDRENLTILRRHRNQQMEQYGISTAKNRVAMGAEGVAMGGDPRKAEAEIRQGHLDELAITGAVDTSTGPGKDALDRSVAKALAEGAATYLEDASKLKDYDRMDKYWKANREYYKETLGADQFSKLDKYVNDTMKVVNQEATATKAAQNVVRDYQFSGVYDRVLTEEGVVMDDLIRAEAERLNVTGWEGDRENETVLRRGGLETLYKQCTDEAMFQAVLGIAKADSITPTEALKKFEGYREKGDPFQGMSKAERDAYATISRKVYTEGGKAPTTVDVAATVQRLNPEATPEELKVITDKADERIKRQVVELSQSQEATYKNIEKAVMGGDFNVELSQGFFQLPAPIQQIAKEFATAVKKGDYQRTKNPYAVINVLNKPEQLRNMSYLDLQKIRLSLGEQGYETVLRRQQELIRGGVPPTEIASSRLTSAIERVYIDAGRIKADETGDPDNKALVMLTAFGLQDAINDYVTQTGSKNGMSDAEVLEWVRGRMSFSIGPDKKWGTVPRLSQLRPKDVNSGIRDVIRKYVGVGDLGPDPVFTQLIELSFNPEANLKGYIPTDEWNLLSDRWAERHNSVPDDYTITHCWLQYKMGSKDWLKATNMDEIAVDNFEEVFSY